MKMASRTLLVILIVGIYLRGSRAAIANPSVSLVDTIRSVVPSVGVKTARQDQPIASLTLEEFSTDELVDSIAVFSNDITNLRGSTTSFSATLISAQIMYKKLAMFDNVLSEVNDPEIQENIVQVQQGVRKAMIKLEEFSRLILVMLENKGGTEILLAQARRNVISLSKDLLDVVLEVPELHKAQDAVQRLENWLIEPSLYSLPTGGIVNLSAVPNNITGKVFKLKNDSSVSTADVFSIIETRGGFSEPIKSLRGKTIGQVSVDGKTTLGLTDGGIKGTFNDKLKKKVSFDLPKGGMQKFYGDAAIKGQGEVMSNGVIGEISSRSNLGNSLVLGNGSGERRADLSTLSKMLASFDNNSMTGNVKSSNSIKSGLAMPALDAGVGTKGSSLLNQSVNIKDLTASGVAVDNLTTGGTLHGILKNVGLGGYGMSTDGSATSGIDMKEGIVSLNLDRAIGGGGSIGNSGVGAGGIINVDSDVDLKSLTANLDVGSRSGIDGNIKLPGELGGLMYNLEDVSKVAAHVDLKDLSDLSLEILKQTDIVGKIDMPGDMKDIEVELHPRLELTNLGRLRVTDHAGIFTRAIGGLTKFNMLEEQNLVTAIAAGNDFLARLDILDALRHEIGDISALPEVSNSVRVLLIQMETVLASLLIVRTLPESIRNVGESLSRFEVDELKVELPELEALSTAPGVQGINFDDISPDGISTAAQELANFSLGAFSSTAAITEKLISSVTKAKALDLAASEVRNANGIQGLSSAGSLDNLAEMGRKALPVVQQAATQAMQLGAIVDLARMAGLDINKIANIDKIVQLAGLGTSPEMTNILRNIVGIANSNGVDLAGISGMANLLNVVELARVLKVSEPVAQSLLGGTNTESVKSNLTNTDKALRNILNTTNNNIQAITTDPTMEHLSKIIKAGASNLNKTVDSVDIKKIASGDIANDIATSVNNVLKADAQNLNKLVELGSNSLNKVVESVTNPKAVEQIASVASNAATNFVNSELANDVAKGVNNALRQVVVNGGRRLRRAFLL